MRRIESSRVGLSTCSNSLCVPSFGHRVKQREKRECTQVLLDALVPSQDQADFYTLCARRFDDVVPSAEGLDAKRKLVRLLQQERRDNGSVPAQELRLARRRYNEAKSRAKHSGCGDSERPSRDVVLRRLRQELERPLPSNFLCSRNEHGSGKKAWTRKRVAELFFAPSTQKESKNCEPALEPKAKL